MDWHYHALLNALLQAQSVDELIALAQQHPELLSEEFLSYVQQQLALFRLMNPQAAAEIDEIEHEVSVRLQILVQAIAAHTQSAPYTANMLAIPDHIPPSSNPRAAWAKPFREYIARGFRDEAPLREALRRAQQAGENEIAALLSKLLQIKLNASLPSCTSRGVWRRRTACCYCRQQCKLHLERIFAHTLRSDSGACCRQCWRLAK
jgi:hypothetical protein